MKIIRPEWKRAMLEQIETNSFKEATVEYNPASAWLILQLDAVRIPFKVITLGAGVRKIVRDDRNCPYCHKKL